jgi:hypothetical protein
MSQSLLIPADTTPIEDFEHAGFSPETALEYYVKKTPEWIVHHERRVDQGGKVIYDLGLPVAFSVGSGTRGRSYLINIEGRLFASPITWYSQPGRWDLSPGYAAENNKRFDRQVSEGCLACHAGRVALHDQDRDRFADPPLLELSIGCERCHGPGGQHVAHHAAEDARENPDSIVNPRKLSGARRDSVCNQCHLQGQRRVVRLGRSEFDFRPGMFLSDNWVIFVKTAGIESGAAAAVSQVEQMYASRCYRKSNGSLGCISCHAGHDAHQDELSYRETCLSCHEGTTAGCSEDLVRRQQVTKDDSCITCHMPKFAASDVHAAQTDHRILRQVRSQEPDAQRPPRPRDDVPVLFEEPGAKVVDKEWNRARGIFLGERVAAGGTADQAQAAVELLQPLENNPSGDVEGLYYLGRALQSLNRPNRAVKAWERVVALQPRHEAAIDALAVHSHETRDLAAARHYYERLIEINPGKARYYGRLAHVLGQEGHLPQAIEAAEKCLELDPSLSQSHAWLVEACRNSGDDRRAAYHESKLRQFQSLTKQKR